MSRAESASHLVSSTLREPTENHAHSIILPEPRHARIQAQAVDRIIRAIAAKLQHDYPQLVQMFEQCFPNTLETTTELLDDGTTFVFTGDIPAMWLRDSSAQVRPYVPLAGYDEVLRRVVRGLIQRQVQYILIDPYANAFNREPNGHGHATDRTEMGPWIWERKWEIDSLCYPIQLAHDYYSATGDRSIFDIPFYQMLQRIVAVLRVEQHHDQWSPYVFERDDTLPSDTLPCGGRGTRTNETGMVWSGFRPSDDACMFGYNIPGNMFAVVALGHVITFARDIYGDQHLAKRAAQLQGEIAYGVETYGIVDHPRFGRIYAYETDGFGNYNFMDDANVPSLLAIPYLGYRSADDPVYQRTRAFVLSDANPFYVNGTYTRGVGSPHTPTGHVWPLGMIMQGLTATQRSEQDAIMAMLVNTTAGTNVMHESFHPDHPEQYTRPWFAWASSLFGEFVMRWSGIDIRAVQGA